MDILDKFVRDHHSSSITWAREHLNDDLIQDAEDIVQDTYEEVLSSGVELLEPTAKTYIFGMIQDNCYDYNDKSVNRDRLFADNVLEVRKNLGNQEDAVGHDPLDALIASEDMTGRLGALSPLNRDTLERIYIEGVDPATLAEEEGVTVDAIWKRVERLKKILKGDEDEAPVRSARPTDSEMRSSIDTEFKRRARAVDMRLQRVREAVELAKTGEEWTL